MVYSFHTYFVMSFRSVVAVIRHGDRTPKQKMKMEVRHPKFFELFDKYAGNKKGHVKVKKPRWSTCPLVLGYWFLYHVIYLKLKNE